MPIADHLLVQFCLITVWLYQITQFCHATFGRRAVVNRKFYAGIAEAFEWLSQTMRAEAVTITSSSVAFCARAAVAVSVVAVLMAAAISFLLNVRCGFMCSPRVPL